jgi:hypothetical protein
METFDRKFSRPNSRPNQSANQAVPAAFAFAPRAAYLLLVPSQHRAAWVRVRAVVLGLVAVLAGSCGLRDRMSQAPFLAFLAHKSGLICFVGPDGNVSVIDQAGGAAGLLTTDAGSRAGAAVAYAAPTWSPDGKLVAFIRFSTDRSRPAGTVALVSTQADGSGGTTLFSSETLRPFYLCWSPDSRKLSVLSQVVGESTLELGVVAAGAGGSPSTRTAASARRRRRSCPS